MGGKNMTARIYLLEDINDNRYIGSTSEKRLSCRLHTHRRDKKEYEFGVRKNCCSSSKLDLYHCSITELEVVENKKEIRSEREKHYINNVYPECVNLTRFNYDPVKYRKEYYAKNREIKIKKSTEYRKKNKEQYNKSRREHYQRNKVAINKRRRVLAEEKRLANL
tara:strand:- start:1055 stop:1549 length:495 start_codon:yes stop_codon:yes gene_type:complete